MLLSVFTVSFAIPKLNPIIGLSTLCDYAKKVSIRNGVSNYYYCEIRKGDNLDVYLGAKLEMLRISDLYQADNMIRRPAILFLWHKAIERHDSLKQFINGRPIYKTGNYYCIEIE